MRNEALMNAATPEIVIGIMFLFITIFIGALYKVLLKDSNQKLKQAENLPFEEGALYESRK